jgi:hypothetical protein
MRIHTWINDEIIVTGDTAVVPVTVLKDLLLSYTNSVRRYAGDGIYNDEGYTRTWLNDLDNVYFDIARDHRELIEARKLQQEIPF